MNGTVMADPIYHVQHEAPAYYQHIPLVPDSVSINQAVLLGLSESQFIENMRRFFDIMKRMYIDMAVSPEAYGLLLIDINEVNENKEEGNLAKASWRSLKRLGDVIAQIGKHGYLSGDSLVIPTASFIASVRKIEKLHLIINKLIEFGFDFTSFNGKNFDKNNPSLIVSYPEHPHLTRVLKAYAVSEPYHADDPHEFYYFDYKRLADRKKLPAHSVACDLAGLIDEDKGRLLTDVHTCFVDDLGLIPHYKDDSIEYYIKKKRVARFIIDFHNLNVVFILKLKAMDRYIEEIDRLPQNLRVYFEKSSCRYCGFQNSTKEFCKFRVSWTLNDHKYDACNFACFNFFNPESKDTGYFVSLMSKEYRIKEQMTIV